MVIELLDAKTNLLDSNKTLAFSNAAGFFFFFDSVDPLSNTYDYCALFLECVRIKLVDNRGKPIRHSAQGS